MVAGGCVVSLDFVAIDFETASPRRGSPCAIGLAVVEGGRVVTTRSLLVKPVGPGWDPATEPLEDFFNPFNVMIHGITPGMVADAPAFYEAWPAVRELIGDLPMVAHNAAFDTGVLRDALDVAELDWPTLDYACTLVLGRRTYDLVSYRLPFVAQAAGVDFDPNSHHEGGYDAEVAARIMLDVAARHDADSIADVRTATGRAAGSHRRAGVDGMRPLRRVACGLGGEGRRHRHQHRRRPVGRPVRHRCHVHGCAGVDDPRRGVAGGSRRWRSALAVRDEAHHVPGVRVPGRPQLRPGAEVSAKYAKAQELRAKGQDIEIVSEDDWLAMLDQTSSEGRRAT